MNMAPIVIARIDTERSSSSSRTASSRWSAEWSRVIRRWCSAGRRVGPAAAGRARPGGLRAGPDDCAIRKGTGPTWPRPGPALADLHRRPRHGRRQRHPARGGPAKPARPPAARATPSFRSRRCRPSALSPRWDETLRLAEVHRPDLIELKLILEADDQRLRVAKNQALPRLDAVALYRWNGPGGETAGRHVPFAPIPATSPNGRSA